MEILISLIDLLYCLSETVLDNYIFGIYTIVWHTTVAQEESFATFPVELLKKRDF